MIYKCGFCEKEFKTTQLILKDGRYYCPNCDDDYFKIFKIQHAPSPMVLKLSDYYGYKSQQCKAICVELLGLKFWFSYGTLIGFRSPETGTLVTDKFHSKTTNSHKCAIDNFSKRVDHKIFIDKVSEALHHRWFSKFPAQRAKVVFELEMD